MTESEIKETGAGDGDYVASNWETRKLCSDENCIGVIGRDGRCGECGKPYAGDPVDPPPGPDPSPPTDAPLSQVASDESAGSGDEWENRRLCSDENCIGVIGPDGRCKECGKPSAG